MMFIMLKLKYWDFTRKLNCSENDLIVKNFILLVFDFFYFLKKEIYGILLGIF